MKMSIVKKGKYIEIQMLKEILEDNNIKCYVSSEHGEGFVMSTGNFMVEYTLFVNSDDFVEASAICDSFIGEKDEEL